MTDAAPERRLAVLVLGMHRSGTSAVARLVSLLGADPPTDILAGGDGNQAGYWEPGGLVAVHDRLLREIDSSWFDPRPPRLARLADAARAGYLAELRQQLRTSFGRSACFVLKDPRICRMVPLYRRLLAGLGAEVRVVLVVRDPTAVARSLRRRNLLSLNFAGLLWASHTLAAERDTRDLPRVVVSYDALMEDWREPAGRLARLLAPAVPPFDPAAMPSPIQPELRHHAPATRRPFGSRLGVLLGAIHDALAGGMPPERLDRLGERHRRILAATRDLWTIEFRAQQLMPPWPHGEPPDPVALRYALARALDRLHHSALAAGRADLPARGAPT
ncbi:sulfotransferase family protein [Stella sp.]|uniref:sulfotransferase family protein n=1 Tax=Stella sp. TaxID=2912054 RepID=UPI0035AF0EA8